MVINSRETVKTILRECSIIAVVGLSSKPYRPSYGVARYMKSVGYHIIPVNPNETEILGETVYPTLQAIPGKVDVVDIFRRSDLIMPIVEDAIAIGARAIWMQEGVINEEASRKAAEAGLWVVFDRCLLKEHLRLDAANPAS